LLQTARNAKNSFPIEKTHWYHFAPVVFELGNTGYLNGVELTYCHYNAGTKPSDIEFFASVTSRKLFALGFGTTGRANSFQSYKGIVDEVRIYNRPL